MDIGVGIEHRHGFTYVECNCSATISLYVHGDALLFLLFQVASHNVVFIRHVKLGFVPRASEHDIPSYQSPVSFCYDLVHIE